MRPYDTARDALTSGWNPPISHAGRVFSHSSRGRRPAWLSALAAATVAGLACAPSNVAPSGSPPVARPAPAPPVPAGEVRVAAAAAAPRVATATTDRHGAPVTVACATCHSVKPPDPATRTGADLDLFHQGLTTAHGDLTCLSCHDDRDYDRLRLADMTPVPFPEVASLCRQCHGPQARDYARGAHGGMTGHWDLTRGGRDRNGCTTCHDPHAPAIPRVLPAPGPVDRVVVSPAPQAAATPHASPRASENRP